MNELKNKSWLDNYERTLDNIQRILWIILLLLWINSFL